VLAFQKAALASHYALSTAMNGRRKVPQIDPAAILLDLSMPEMDGDEVLAHLQDHPDHRRIPVIIISSEKLRAEACLRNGAKAFLPKPIRAQELLPLVERVLEDARAAARAGNVAALFVSVGKIELGLPLDCVRGVMHQTATQPLPLGPSYLAEMIELHGEPVAVLDLARRLGVSTRSGAGAEAGGGRARGRPARLCVDDVRDPEELTASEVTSANAWAAASTGAADALLGGPTARPAALIIRALVSRELLASCCRVARRGCLRVCTTTTRRSADRYAAGTWPSRDAIPPRRCAVQPRAWAARRGCRRRPAATRRGVRAPPGGLRRRDVLLTPITSTGWPAGSCPSRSRADASDLAPERGCATGEEAYSIAACLLDLLPVTVQFEVLGTDLLGRNLAAARNGEYGAWSRRPAGPLLHPVFEESGGDRVRILAAVREATRFEEHNLLDEPPGVFDLIFVGTSRCTARCGPQRSVT
jgi:CheY-like chemotaxis protein/chemotaxis signal transduction protein